MLCIHITLTKNRILHIFSKNLYSKLCYFLLATRALYVYAYAVHFMYLLKAKLCIFTTYIGMVIIQLFKS